MPVRSTMAALITRVRTLINDTGGSPIFSDQTIQDVMDEARVDHFNLAMQPYASFSGSTVTYQDYMTEAGGWEDDYVVKQYLTTTVTVNSAEPIAGRFHFTATTLPPLFISGKLFDVYRSAADLLERWAAMYALRFDFTSDGQSFHVSQASTQLLKLATQYRMKQRAMSIEMKRTDSGAAQSEILNLAPHDIDYFAAG